ncbi:MAG: hypothetical protein ACYTXA_33095 [Nostoc sp.]
MRSRFKIKASDAFGWLLYERLRQRLRTVTFCRRSLFLTNHRGAEDTESEESDRIVEFYFRSAIAFLSHAEDTEDSR